MAADALETVEQEAPEFPDVRVDRRFVINRDNRDFVLMAGLVDMLHQLSDGFFAVETHLAQVPTKENEQTAIVTARAVVFDPENLDVMRRVATGIGDASPANVNRMMAPHLIRMAETRAVARALRLLTNVGMTVLEELGPQGAEDTPERASSSTQAPFTPHQAGLPDRIKIGDQLFTRAQVWAGYRKRVAEAKAAGLALPDDQADLREDAPLSAMVGASQAIRRRLEARDGTGE